MRLLLALLPLLLLTAPALAQFPPPGVYACIAADGTALGELTLLVAGDYSFRHPDGETASGQLASAGTDVNPLSGPLRDMGLSGTFDTDETGATTFAFTSPDGLAATCH